MEGLVSLSERDGSLFSSLWNGLHEEMCDMPSLVRSEVVLFQCTFDRSPYFWFLFFLGLKQICIVHGRDEFY